MSDTPRTNNYIENFPGSRREPRLLDFARQLEKELKEARAEIERLKEWEYCMKTQAPYEAAGATWELRHKHDQAVIAERDKLIEQMREAISDVLRHAEPPQHDIRGCMRANCWWCQVIRVRDAALSAAERGE